MKKNVLILLSLIAAHLTASAQQWQDTVSRIEAIFSKYQPDKPGCMVSISRNGQVIYSKAWGLADLEHNVPLTTHSVTEAGSVSKQFTAAAILLLEQQGKLSTDDDVRKYIPELPDYGNLIRIRHLLHHASGLRDWGAVAEIAGWPRTTKAYTNDDALDIIIRQKALNYSPNEEFLYSNSNYNLLAIIVQRVSGMSLAEFTQRYIFEPAGMTHTQWRDDYKRIVPDRALAYSKDSGIYRTNMPNENAYGNGGLLTTTEDLLKWSDFYGTSKLGGAAFLAKQLATENLNNGKSNSYGAGLFLGRKWSYDWINHSGATAGYRAFLETFPQLHLSIAWLSNTSEFDGWNPVELLNMLFIPGKNQLTHNQVQGTPVYDSTGRMKYDLNDYTGNYYSAEAQAGITVIAKDGKLWMVRPGGRTGVLRMNRTDHSSGPAGLFDGESPTIDFIREKKKVTGFTVTVSRARNVLFVKNAWPGQ